MILGNQIRPPSRYADAHGFAECYTPRSAASSTRPTPSKIFWRIEVFVTPSTVSFFCYFNRNTAALALRIPAILLAMSIDSIINFVDSRLLLITP